MQRWNAFRQLILARIREFYREPEVIFWVYGFPLLLAVGLGVAFSSSQPEPPVVDVQEQPSSTMAQELVDQLKKENIKAAMFPEKQCQERLTRGRSHLYLVLGPKITFVYDAARAEGVLARHWAEAALWKTRAGAGGLDMDEETVKEPGKRYIDFLLPGLIGMNIMGGGLFGVGFVLVDMRVRKLFKRLLATPMHRGEFLLALVTTRMLFLTPEMLSLLLVGHFGFGVPVRGSILCLLAVIVVGALAFAGIGLLVASRTEKTETISGLINLVMLPMYLLSGIFFPSTRYPEEVQPFIQALPLTQLNDALRAVMLEGAGFMDSNGIEGVGWRLGILAMWAGCTFFLALRWFRWR